MVTHHPIKVWRFNSGQTQGVFAARVETSTSHISDIERWRRAPSLALARRIAKFTGLSLDEVLMECPTPASAPSTQD